MSFEFKGEIQAQFSCTGGGKISSILYPACSVIIKRSARTLHTGALVWSPAGITFFLCLWSRILSLHSFLCGWTGGTSGVSSSFFTLPITFPFPAARGGNTDDIANTLSVPYPEDSFVKGCTQGPASVAEDLKMPQICWNARSDLGWKQALSVASFIYGIPTVIFFF